MIVMLARHWGLVALRGAAALVFGLITLFFPLIGLTTLVLLFGVFSFADGVFTTAAAIAGRREDPHWVAFLVSGLLAIAIGLVALLWPRVTTFALLYLIAAWAIIIGLAAIVVGIRLREVITGEWLLILAGALAAIVGLLFAIFPGAGAIALALWIGAFATLLGILWLALALRLRRWYRAWRDASARPGL